MEKFTSKMENKFGWIFPNSALQQHAPTLHPKVFRPWKLGQTYIDGDLLILINCWKSILSITKTTKFTFRKNFVELNPREFKSEIIDRIRFELYWQWKLERRAEEGKYIKHFFDNEFKLKKHCWKTKIEYGIIGRICRMDWRLGHKIS